MFEPQKPVKILQRGKKPQSEVAKQTPKETGKLAEILGMIIMAGPAIGTGIK